MGLIDDQFTKMPFYGPKRMIALLHCQGQEVNHMQVCRLMKLMGLEAIDPKPRLSLFHQAQQSYLYLLKNVVIDHPDQLWCPDITYIRMLHEIVYLVVIMGWYSRTILAGETSNTLDTQFCRSALEKTFKVSKPEILNTDQASQFVRRESKERLKKEDICISMDDRARLFYNIFVERLWRSAKYEVVYLNQYQTVSEARHGLARYFLFYKRERFHEPLGCQTPYELYVKEGVNSNLMRT